LHLLPRWGGPDLRHPCAGRNLRQAGTTSARAPSRCAEYVLVTFFAAE
jgi:hypothetical protein